MTRQGSRVLVNMQDLQAPTVGPCKTCPHPQREFFEFLQFLCGCVLVQPFFAVHSSFCSVNSCFPPFVRVLFGEFEVSTVCLSFNRRSEVFHRSFKLSIGFLGVSCRSRGVQSAVRFCEGFDIRIYQRAVVVVFAKASSYRPSVYKTLGSLRTSNRLFVGSIVAEGDFVRRTLVC